MDNLSLEALVRELRPRVLNKPIQKIKNAGEWGLIFHLRSSFTDCLVLSLYPTLPGIFIADEDCPSKGTASDALLTLRKYLVGGRITQVRKELADRVVFLDIENYRLSEQVERFTLVLELIPNKVTGILLDEQRVVLAVFPPDREGNFPLSSSYKVPDVNAGFRVDMVQQESFLKLFLEGDASSPKQIPGLSPAFSNEVLHRGMKSPQASWEALQDLLDQIRNGPYLPRIYSLQKGARKDDKVPIRTMDNGGVVDGREDFSVSLQNPSETQGMLSGSIESLAEQKNKQVLSPIALDSLAGAACETFDSMNDAFQALCRPALQGDMLSVQRQSRLNTISVALKKRMRLRGNLQTDLDRSQRAEIFKVYADLLYAQSDRSPKGVDKLMVVNLFDPELPEIQVPLDPRGSVIQNANRYNKMFQKANRSMPVIRERIRRVEAEIENLLIEKKELVDHSLSATPVLERAVDMKSNTVSQTVKKQGPGGKDGNPKPLDHSKDAAAGPKALLQKVAKVFVSSEGLEILVGRNSKDNDILTSKVARNEDFWLHVGGYGGSHVVLRNPNKLEVAPKQSLLEAAQLAAYFSQARNAPKVEVHYTQKRFVSKPKGAKPGLVRLKEYRSISARPQLLSKAEED